MGHGIAYLFAAAGHQVRVHDANPAALDTLPGRLRSIQLLLGDDDSVLTRIQPQAQLEDAVRDARFVFEAAAENIAVKQALFADIERLVSGDTVLASNTSAIPIHLIARDLRHKARMVGAHFWNPPHLVPLVEVVQMAPENLPAVESMMELLRAAGRHPVHVRRDVPGFIGNRLQHALKREAIALVASGICDAETVDDVVKLGFGPRLAVLGPLEQSDMVGLDLTKSIHDVLIQDLDRTPHAQDYLNQPVTDGNLGMKTGQGFRHWTPALANALREKLSAFLAAAARRSKSQP